MQEFKLLIDGELVAGDSSMDVINPATGKTLTTCPRGSQAQMEVAIAAARKAFPAWSGTPIGQRRELLVKLAEAIQARRDDLARVLTQEQGKPLKEAKGEVAGAVGFLQHFASMDLPVKVIEESDARRIEQRRTPLGVVGLIVPWNFPFMLASGKLGPALLAGNTVVLKPAPTTPLTTLMLGELCADILPPGVVNIVTDQNDLGAYMTGHPNISKISFTGSSQTGRKVIASAAETVKRITLELSGNDAAIVLDDADPETIAKNLFGRAFANAGQVCLAIKRLYVHESIYDQVVELLGQMASAAVVGDGLEDGTTFGPVQNKMQYDKVMELIEDARKNGKIVAGNEPVPADGYFIRPTIVSDVTDGQRVVDEEQFGPVLPVIKYSDTEDAIARANNSGFGLGGSVWGKDVARATELAGRLEAGTVWVNSHQDIAPNVPFGGAKQSGIGCEFGEEGLAEFTQLKVVSIVKAA